MSDLNGNPFDAYLDGLAKTRAKQQSTQLNLGTGEPAAAAEAVELGGELNVPPQAVLGAPELFRGRATQGRATTALSTAPKLSEWLGDPINGAMSKDDLDNLTWFERNLGAMGRAIGRGTRRISAAPDNMSVTADVRRSSDVGRSLDDLIDEELQRVGGDRAPASSRVAALQSAQLRFDAIEGQGEAERLGYLQRGAESLASANAIIEKAASIPMSDVAAGFRDGTLAESENTIAGTLGAFVTDPIAGAAFIAETLAEMLPVLGAATLTTAVTRTPAAGVAVMSGGSLLTESTSSSIQFLQEKGVDMSTPEAAALVLQDRALMREAQELGFERGLIIAVFDAVSGGVAGQALLKNPAGDAVAQGIAQIALGSGGEATAQLATTGEIDAREVVIEGLAELATAPVEVAGVAGRRVMGDVARFSRSGETASVIDEVDEVAGASQVRDRSVAKYQEALEASGIDDAQMYVSAEGLQEYFQAKDVELDDETLRAWGVEPDDFREKVTSGGDVTVPVANYAAQISGSEDAAFFRDNAVFTRDEMSISEAETFNSEVQDIMAAAFDEAEANAQVERSNRESDVQIYDEVFSQLRAAGRSPDVAQNEAQVWSAFWRSMGDRYGEDALDLARSMGVRIQGPQTPEVARRRDQLDAQLNTLRAQGAKALRPSGVGVLDFVKSLGGVRDRGGDVEALDVPKGVIGESRASIAERESQPALGGAIDFNGRGRGLDELGRAMIEAGYFPELLGGADIEADGTVVDEAALALEAITDAVSGRDRFLDGEGPDADLTALSDMLSERGIDLASSNDEIVAALQDDGGQQYDQDGQLVTDTAAFKEWFGDSKVVDENGDPLVVYHGSARDFEAFDIGFAGEATGAESGDLGFFFTANRNDAETYAGFASRGESQMADGTFGQGQQVYDVYLSIENPLIVFPDVDDENEGVLSEYTKIDSANSAIEGGHDGVIFKGFRDSIGDQTGNSPDIFLALAPEQIKSRHNRGAFDANDPRILFQSAPEGSDAFREWAGTDEVLDPDEISFTDFSGSGPFVMRAFHGTTHEFDEFDASVKGTKEGRFGAVNYFTSSLDDAEVNYGATGPDLTNRIERSYERIEGEIEAIWPDILEAADGPEDAYADLLIKLNEDYDFDTGSIDDNFIDGDPDLGVDATALARDISTLAVSGHEDKVLEVFVRTEKPFVVGGDGSPFIEFVDFSDLEARAIDRVAEDEGIEVSEVEDRRDEFEDQIDDARWELEAETENPLMQAIQEAADRHEFDASDLLASLSEMAMEGADHKSLEAAMRDGLNAAYPEDQETGDLISHHVLAEIIEALGFDSIILQNADQQFVGMDMSYGVAHIHVFDSHNSNIKSVENEGGFDRSEGNIYKQDKRGSIVLPRGGLTEGQTVINLFESADLSTFLHESGHFFLEAFGKLATSSAAPEAMQDDMAAILGFLGADSMGGLQVEHHEKWARGFEAYLMEGNAPSLGLLSAFSRFKAWLTRIYRTVRGLNVQLNDEIRGVMDRLLATDAEISAMRQDQSLRPLFAEAPLGMSDAEFQTYQRMAGRSVEQAEAKLLKETMAVVRRETLKWFKDEKSAVRAEVEDRVNRMPVYRLTEALANGKWIGRDDDLPNMQIDRAALVERFGEGILPELSRTKLGGKRAIYAKGGESPELVAEFFGFGDVAQMVEELQNAGKRKDYIAAEVDRIMVERHGDPLSDGSIEEAAALAVHNEQQAGTVNSELRTIAKMAGADTKRMKVKLYKQQAKAMIGRMSVREASKPAAFLQAERKAARDAEAAFAKVSRNGPARDKALAEAMVAKEKQLLNQFLHVEAVAFKAKLDKGRETVRGYGTKRVRDKLEGGYIEQIDTLLDRFDFRVRGAGQVKRSENLRAYIDRMIADGREADLAIDPRLMDEARREHYSRLSVDELTGLFDTIQNIDHMGRYKQKLIDRKRKRDLDESASKVAGLVRDRFGSGKSDKQSGGVGNFFNLLMRVDTIAADIDQTEVGVFYDEIKRGLDEGASLEQQMNVEAAGKIEALFEVYDRKEKKALNDEVTIQGGNGKAWTRQQVLSLALNTGNANNRQRILDQRVHEDLRLTEAQLDATLAILDKRDWDFVQSVWDYIETFGDDLAAVTQRRTGVKMERVKAEPVVTPHGTYRGGYYPIAYDPSKSKAAAQDAESAFDKFLAAGRGSAAAVADGMAQSRQATGGGKALNYDFSVMLKHVRDTTRVIALSEPVDNSSRILRHGYVVDAFNEAGQKHLLQTLELYLKDVANGPVYNEDPINGFSRMVKNNFTLSRLAFNFKTVALQVTGLGQSAAVIGKMNLLKGFNDYRKRPVEVSAEIMQRSAFMAERQTTFQKDIYDQANDLRLNSPIASTARKGKNAVSAWGFAPMIKTQFYVVDVPTWLGAYQAELGRGATEENAVHFADRMVDRSQGGGLMTDRNALERGTSGRNVVQSDFVRMWTTLGGYMVTKMNRGYLTVKKGQRDMSEADGLKEQFASAANMASDLVLLYVFEAAMMGLAYSLLAEDEDDDEVKAFMVKEIVGAAFGGIPLVRESVGAFNGYGAGGVLSSVLEIPANIWTQGAQFENDKAFRRSIADAVGFVTGMPTTQSMRIIEEVIEGEDGSLAEAMIGRNPLGK